MSAISSRFETVARVLAQTEQGYSTVLTERLAALYALSQKSNYVFASPLGPFFNQGRHYHLPRFVYFGPHTHDQSLRLAFLTGFNGAKLGPALAATDFLGSLATAPDLGQGLNLSFFPLIDVLGLEHGKPRDLAGANWARNPFPEIDVLEKDARARGYHGFVRIEATADDDVISARLCNDREVAEDGDSTQVELVTSEDFEPWSVRWEEVGHANQVDDGPLTILDDLPVRPFDLLIRLPRSWSDQQQREVTGSVLQKFIARQRGLQSYGQNL